MKEKYILLPLLLLIPVCVILGTKNIVDFKEKLPAKILPGKILWGEIRAYHPDILYKKYEIDFFRKNKIIEKDITVGPGITFKEFYYYSKVPSKYIKKEQETLKKYSPQSFLKFQDENGDFYILTISGDHSGSANFRTISVNLLKYDNENMELIFANSETYSIDPGFDSNYFTEKFVYQIYRFFDNRYK